MSTQNLTQPRGYSISDIDDAVSDPIYFGFLKGDGSWYIMRKASGAWRYAAGNEDYSTNWTNRAGLTYLLYNEVF